MRVYTLKRARFATGQTEKSIHNLETNVINREDNVHGQE